MKSWPKTIDMKKYIALVILMMLLPLGLMAQNPEPVTIKVKVTVHNKENGKDINERVTYSRMLTKKEAQEAHAAIERLTGDKSSNDMSYDMDQEAKVKLLMKKYGFIEKNRTSAKGNVELSTATTMCYLFITGQENKVSDIMEVVPGKTEYNITINVQRLQEVFAQGKMGEREEIGGGTGDPDDGNEYFRVKMKLLKGAARSNARMILQTYAVDCQTDDTTAYCTPLVFEGGKYHELQNKRMDYDYFKNDSLRHGYQASTPLEDDDYIMIDTTLVYKKKDKDASFRGPFKYILEDYHHVYATGGYAGTCLRFRPFKFLDFAPALAEMELTDEFREEAQSQIADEKRDLALSFEVGKASLKEDSMNTVNMNKLVEELRSYGDKLLSPSIQGMASPDGNMKKNLELAQQRAQLAARIIQKYLPSGQRVASTSSVYTWKDVAERLEKKGKKAEAEQVMAIAGKTETPDRELRLLEFYETDIVPILESMRVMKASYKYIREKVLTAQEAVDEFHLNLEQYKAGKKRFSNGDYWNIFNNLTDSAEIDTLTMMAYRDIIRNPEYATENKIAPYVCNRVALINLKKGIPNARILEPFIDLTRRGVNAIKPIDDMVSIIVNRREVLLNQAVTYYQELKMDSCKYFINWLKKYNASDPALESLERIMNLKSLHYNNFRSSEQEQEYEAAKNYVLNISDENKAILYSEIPDWGNTKGGMEYVDMMPDESAKKWYLKGILWAQMTWKELSTKLKLTPGMEIDSEREIREQLEPREPEDNSGKPDLGNGFFLLTEDEETDLMATDYNRYALYNQQKQKYMDEHDGQLPQIEKKEKPKNADDDIDIEGIPFYLAYFQRCFELEPQFKRMYFNEAHVPEDLRKIYKYKRAKIPAYDKLFRLLQAYDERMEQEKLEKLKAPAEEEKKEDAHEDKNAAADTAAM